MKSGREFRVVGRQSARNSMVVGGRVLAQPHFHQSHKDSIARNEGLVQVIGLSLPLFSQFECYFLNKGGELIELLFGVAAGKKVEVGVVEYFPFFGPGAVVGFEGGARVVGFLGRFVVHLQC